MAAMMKEMAGLGMRDRMQEMQELQQGGFLDPGNRLPSKSGHRQAIDGRRKTETEKAARKRAAEEEAGIEDN